MLETLIFREIRYNGNNERFLKEIQQKVAENPEDIDALETLASTYHALKENEKAKNKTTTNNTTNANTSSNNNTSNNKKNNQ